MFQACPVRRAILWLSSVLAVGGWLSALHCWWMFGQPAGAMAMFVMEVAVAMTFSIVACIVAVLPDAQRIYSIAFRDGRGSRDVAEPRHLTAVR